MSIVVDITPATSTIPVSRTRISITVPVGVEWALHGRSGHHEWQAAHGVGTGSAQWVTDPLAPLGREAVYELRYGSTAEASWPVMRPSAGSDLVTDLSGRTVARVVRMVGDGDPWEFVQRPSVLEMSGQYLPTVTRDVASAGPGGATVETDGGDTRTMTALARRGEKVVVHHDERVCEIPDCDIAPSVLVTLMRVSAGRTGHVDRAVRSWDLTWIEARFPWLYSAPVATWGDVQREFADYADVHSRVADHSALTAGEWL